MGKANLLPLGNKSRTVLHRAVRDVLLPLTDDPMEALDRDTFGRVTVGIKIDGVPVEVVTDYSNDQFLWGRESRLTITVGSRTTFSLLDDMSRSWSLQVFRSDQRVTEFMGPLTAWVSYLSIQKVVDKIIEALQDLPGPDALTEDSYPRGFVFRLDKETIFGRSDYESDDAFEAAILEASEGIQEKWEKLGHRIKVVTTPAKSGLFLSLGIDKCTSNKAKQKPTLSLPLNQLGTMHEAVKTKLEELRGVYENPPHDRIIDDATLKRVAKSRAKELIEIHNDFYSSAAAYSHYWHWKRPVLKVDW